MFVFVFAIYLYSLFASTYSSAIVCCFSRAIARTIVYCFLALLIALLIDIACYFVIGIAFCYYIAFHSVLLLDFA